MFHCRRTDCPNCVRQWQSSSVENAGVPLLHPKA
jgi:hypothetical protein